MDTYNSRALGTSNVTSTHPDVSIVIIHFYFALYQLPSEDLAGLLANKVAQLAGTIDNKE